MLHFQKHTKIDSPLQPPPTECLPWNLLLLTLTSDLQCLIVKSQLGLQEHVLEWMETQMMFLSRTVGMLAPSSSLPATCVLLVEGCPRTHHTEYAAVPR